MSKTAKKNHWILKYIIFAVICVVVSIFGFNINKNLPNIIGIIYILAGVIWFYIHTKVQIKVPSNIKTNK